MRMFTKDDEGLSKQHRTLGRSVVLDSKKIEPDEYCEVCGTIVFVRSSLILQTAEFRSRYSLEWAQGDNAGGTSSL